MTRVLAGAGLLLALQLPVPQQAPAPPPPPTGIIAGRVVDAAGAPVANAIVSAIVGQAGPTTGRGAQGDRVATNAEGRFVFTNLAAGPYRVEVSKPGWLTGAYARRRPGGVSLTVTLTDGE